MDEKQAVHSVVGLNGAHTENRAGVERLNMYMGFSRGAGPQEGACLVFANSTREARKLAHIIVNGWSGEGWLDTGVRRLRDMPWLCNEATSTEPHVIESPRSCRHCELWGISPLDDDGLCEDCALDAKDCASVSAPDNAPTK